MIQASAAWQVSRVFETLRSVGALDESGRLRTPPAWEFGPASDVQSIVFLLDQFGEIDRLRPLFEGRADDPFAGGTSSSDLAKRVTALLKVDKLPYTEDTSGTYTISSNRTNGAVSLGDYDLLVPDIPWSSGTTRSVIDPPILIEMTPTSMNIVSRAERVVVTTDMLHPAIDRRIAEMKPDPEAPQKPLMANLTVGGRKLGILIESANGRSNAEAFELGSAWFDLYLVSSDWR
jgi:hypothetical protein